MKKNTRRDAIERLRDERATLSGARDMLERTKRRIDRIERELDLIRIELSADIISEIASYMDDHHLRARIADTINKHIKKKFDNEQRSIH